MMMTCTRCKKTKHTFEFHKHPKGKNGRYPVCKQCRAFDRLRGNKQKPAVVDPTVTHKVCKTCEMELPLEDFYKSPTGKHGVEAHCKECKAYNKQIEKHGHVRHEPLTDPALYDDRKVGSWTEFIPEGFMYEKTCSCCGNTKPFDDFHVSKTQSFNRYNICKDCKKLKRQQKRDEYYRLECPITSPDDLL